MKHGAGGERREEDLAAMMTARVPSPLRVTVGGGPGCSEVRCRAPASSSKEIGEKCIVYEFVNNFLYVEGSF